MAQRNLRHRRRDPNAHARPYRAGVVAGVTAALALAVPAAAVAVSLPSHRADSTRLVAAEHSLPTLCTTASTSDDATNHGPQPTRGKGHGHGHGQGHGTTVEQEVEVTVPAMVIAHVDGDGAVLAASTNTGAPPSAADRLYAIGPDHRQEPVTSAVRRAVLNGCYVGSDWSTPGAFHARVSR